MFTKNREIFPNKDNIEQTARYRYLGKRVQPNWNHRKELLAIAVCARSAFMIMKKLLHVPT